MPSPGALLWDRCTPAALEIFNGKESIPASSSANAGTHGRTGGFAGPLVAIAPVLFTGLATMT
jgi:hypothetical protein